MILVKDRTGSKNGTADSTLVGVFDSKRPLYRIVKWLILHIFPPVFRLLYGFRVVGRIPEEKMQNGCISVCNHVHKLDCVMLACVFQDYTMQFLSLESNLHIPVAGAIVRLMGYLSEDKGRLIFVFFCVIAGTIANLAGSYMLRPIINGLTGEGSSAQKLLHSLLTMAGIYIIGVTAQYLQQRIMIGVSQGALEKIRNDLFVKMQHLPVRFYDTNNHGDLMSRYTNDLDAVGDMLHH